jgi:hypothetical protein
MIENRLIWLFLFVSQFAFSQIKGVVIDSLSGEPIPYVNIWVENEAIGTTSEANGTFEIQTAAGKNLVFSVLGYQRKYLAAKENMTVLLSETTMNLKEVVLVNKKATKFVEIGKTPNTIKQAFDNGPKMNAKFFPYQSSYAKTKFIQKITVYTDSKIEDALVKIHLYEVDENGFPGNELLPKELLVTIKKGVLKHSIDVSEHNLSMPKNGVFASFERLLIERNKLGTKYQPYILYNFVERDFLFTFSGGKWNKMENKSADVKEKMRFNEPAIYLILSN